LNDYMNTYTYITLFIQTHRDTDIHIGTHTHNLMHTDPVTQTQTQAHSHSTLLATSK
jgi:hypothetical protein